MPPPRCACAGMGASATLARSAREMTQMAEPVISGMPPPLEMGGVCAPAAVSSSAWASPIRRGASAAAARGPRLLRVGELGNTGLEGSGPLVRRCRLHQNVRWGDVLLLVVGLIQAVALGHHGALERRSGIEPLVAGKRQDVRADVGGLCGRAPSD